MSGAILFIFSIIAVGFLIDLIIMGISSLRVRFSKDICPSVRKVPLYFAFGATGYTFYGTLLSISGINLSIASFLIFAFVLLVFVLALYRTFLVRIFRFSYILKINRQDSLIIVALLSIAILIACKMVQRIAFPFFDIDLFGHLLSKAKILLFTTYKDAFFFHDPLFANLHTNYPPMFGVFYNLLFLFVGGAYASYFYLVNYFVIFCIGYSVYVFLIQRISKWQAVVWFLVCISCRNYLTQIYLVDNADLMISLFFLLACCELFYFFLRNDRYYILTSGVLAGAAALLKNEGILFVLFAVFVILAASISKGLHIKQGFKNSFLFLLVFFLLTGLWWVYRGTLPTPDEVHENLLFRADLMGSLPYLSKTFSLFTKELFSLGWHGIFIFWLASFLFFKSGIRSGIILFSLFVFVQLSFYLLIMWLCYGQIIDHHIPGMRRLIAHCYPVAVMLAGVVVGTYIRAR